MISFVVRANAKIHILKQFTTKYYQTTNILELYVLMQRYTFWSNSQLILAISAGGQVVRANAKIHILKQFTTKLNVEQQKNLLYVLMQRYTFWSNSQLGPVLAALAYVVRANAKIHILKQFTTSLQFPLWERIVVRANAKIHILKQFTTELTGNGNIPLLYVLMQRYTFWSNSQLTGKDYEEYFSCTC